MHAAALPWDTTSFAGGNSAKKLDFLAICEIRLTLARATRNTALKLFLRHAFARKLCREMRLEHFAPPD